MFLKSIRWRLQIWYGLILIAVLAGFGFTAWQLERSRVFRMLNDELLRRVGTLANALAPQHGRQPGREPFPPGPPGEGVRPEDRTGLPPHPRPGPPERFGGPPVEFHLPAAQTALFDQTDTNGFYYVLWRRDGSELARSANAPASVSMPIHPPAPQPQPPELHGSRLEVSIFTPPGEIVLVGRSITPQLAEIRRVGWSLVTAGSAVLLLGLAGGWWLATRAIRPIEDISATAVRISAGDLSQRIDAADTENELGKLADVLNSTFARLEAAFARQKQFTSDASHELRTPVSVILTQTQTALARERSAADYRATVEACRRAAQRMKRLIESLLELARLDAGQAQLKREPVDLAVTAADCVELIRPLAEERGATIQTELTRAVCVGDGDKLALVVTNLLTNAIRYGREGGHVLIRTQNGESGAALTVSDDGPGISPEHRPHIFDRFYRADTARTSAEGRSGLGLAISKAIVDAHGGSIDVTTEPGTGATFTVRLPSAPNA